MKRQNPLIATVRYSVQDRRAASRILTRLKCQFIAEGSKYEAQIRDISVNGAFLWSTFMPQIGADVSIMMPISSLEHPLKLEATVVRRDCKYSDRGKVNAFGVRFSSSSLEFVKFVREIEATFLRENQSLRTFKAKKLR